MAPIKRSEFLGAAFTSSIPAEAEVKANIDNEFANKAMPKFDEKSNTGITQYSGTFGTAQLQHLLRRTLFGVTVADMNHFAGMTLDQVVAALLTAAPTPAPPLNSYNANTPDANIAAGATWVSDVFQSGTVNSARKINFKEWWVGLMINQDRSITEKMTLFWHNHFATQMAIVNDARYSYVHNALLRANALGNFKTLTRLVTTDPNMLVYLNGDTNTLTNPNENYGRESQELFTVGKGPNSLYSQADVEAAAKVLTGWKDNKTTITSSFISSKHDTSDKQFSSFYNNTLIAGQTGANGANETDLYIDMIFQQVEAAKFMCRKLYRWFIYYSIDDTIETNVIGPLADLMVQNNFDMVPVLSTLFKSEHFFDPENVGCHIKNPIDHLVGVCRQFNIAFPDNTNLANQYLGWGIVVSSLQALSMDPGDPPNVAGWPAYYQEPQYHELWINSDTLPLRNKYTDALCSANGFTKNSVNLKIDVLAFATSMSNPSDPNQLIADCASLLSPNDLGTTQTAFLKTILLSGQTNDAYWTSAWNQYIGTPSNTTYQNTVATRLRSMLTYIMDLAEYQLI